MLIVLLMIVILLAVPIYILYHLTELDTDPRANTICIGVLIVFTLLFAACISLVTRESCLCRNHGKVKVS